MSRFFNVWGTIFLCYVNVTITWKHAADKNMNCMQQHKKMRKVRGWTWTACYTKHNTTYVDRVAQGWSELEAARSYNMTEHGAWVSKPRHGAKDMSAGIRTPCSNMKQGNRARRWEYTRGRMLTRKQRHDGSVRDLWTEVTEPWK